MTLPLPMRPGHVHAYLLDGADGWTVVDTGVGIPEASELWREELERAGGRVARVFVTHFHPDHVGAAADLHQLLHRRQVVRLGQGCSRCTGQGHRGKALGQTGHARATAAGLRYQRRSRAKHLSTRCR